MIQELLQDKVVMAIIVCSIITYSLRVGGLLIAHKLQRFKRVEQFLAALPGTVLVALIVPEIMKSGAQGFASASLVVGAMIATKNVFVAMLAGVVAISLMRYF